jgi:hypothetical protein
MGSRPKAKCKRVYLRLEGVAEAILDLIHDLQERRVHVPEQGQGLCGEDPGVGVRRACTPQGKLIWVIGTRESRQATRALLSSPDHNPGVWRVSWWP